MLTAWAWLCTGVSRVIGGFVHMHTAIHVTTHITSLQVKILFRKKKKMSKEVTNTTGIYKKKKKKRKTDKFLVEKQ